MFGDEDTARLAATRIFDLRCSETFTWGSHPWLRAGLLAGFLCTRRKKAGADAGLQAGMPAPHAPQVFMFQGGPRSFANHAAWVGS